MLYLLLTPLKEHFSIFNVFRYITFRASYAAVTSLILCFILGPFIIRWLKKIGIRDNVRPYLEDSHSVKKGTATMGGIIMLASVVISVLFWCNLSNRYVIIALFSLIWLGVIGVIDDVLKVKKKVGLSAKTKLLGQLFLGLILGLVLTLKPQVGGYENMTSLLFLKNYFLNLGWFYTPFIIFVIVGTSNAVNITDGLDGLATGLIIVTAIGYGILSYITGNTMISEYLNILFVNGSGELAILCVSIAGAALGFLWFNSHPAQVFMGDTGSLALGGVLAVTAVLIKQEILLILFGGVFLIEALSVIMQVTYFKLTKGKRLFKMAPIHHHFEKMGWPEEKIVVRLWIIGILLAVVGLSTLKIR
ncbi:MAG: phospho-N-acetylmuramoyl-pentapeptide-transferase [Candidatus Cloacimonas sp. 4484_209]|nr:MAG: phospho-N-acetylmuramoyl-pentapeptide-transferase [Candidatus Cloacimonas sp. 4484_209]